MTKEELEKEAEKFLGGWLVDPEIVKLLVDFAEPREKQIEIDAEHIRALQKQNGELTDKVKKLEKRCANYEMNISKMEKGTCDICKETEKDDQLTKAKELLKRFIALENCTLDYDDIKEAEQFLNEVEK